MFPLGNTKCWKNNNNGPMNKAYWRKIKRYEHTHKLINMNQIFKKDVKLNPIQSPYKCVNPPKTMCKSKH